jgi:DNA-binding SARP family transcriptional activator
MGEPLHLWTHLERLLSRLEALEAPLIEVWGWPGSGRTALLEALLARHLGAAVGLPHALFAAEDTAREALARAGDCRWLVVSGDAGAHLSAAARWLRPGQRLVVASSRRPQRPLPGAALLGPQELLLTPGEVGSLLYLLTGEAVQPPASQALWEAGDGWYRPLRLAIEATGGQGLENASPELLLDIPPVRFFLRHEVLDPLAERERQQLLAAGDQRPGEDAPSGSATAWRLVDRLGLWVAAADRDRLPRLLSAWLQRERERRGPAAVPIAARFHFSALAADPLDAYDTVGSPTAAHLPQSPAAERTPARRRVAASPLPATPPAPGEPAGYSLLLLGEGVARLRQAGAERDLEWRLRRSFQVLAFLATSPELEATSEEIKEAVWPTEGEQTIERNFHPTLSYLRRTLEAGRRDSLPAPLVHRGGAYRLNPEVDWEIDVHCFDRLVQQGRTLASGGEPTAAAAAWLGAWHLYRGPFLHGHDEDWAVRRRERYQRQHVALLRDLGDLLARLGRGEEAVDAYRALLAEDPLQERVHQAIMRLLAVQGRRDLVRRQYDRLCALLAEELGVEPMPETSQEYHRLMT